MGRFVPPPSSYGKVSMLHRIGYRICVDIYMSKFSLASCELKRSLGYDAHGVSEFSALVTMPHLRSFAF